eukprot:9854405-Ditylum_brightwellii.AAC.1
MAQEEVDLHTGLAQATGGQVSPDVEKSCWYLLEFQWDKQGKWSLVDNDAQLMINTNKGKLPIHCLAPFEASCILGVWLAPYGNNKTQVAKLRKVIANWMNRLQSGHIHKEDAWYYY